VPVPDAIDDDSACQLYINPLTAWLMVVEGLHLRAGDTLAVNAVWSACRRIIAQLARLNGVAVIAVVRSDGYSAALRELGARAVINTTGSRWSQPCGT
jgi:NADPH:quinone reductase-like Zn-dependent oxidoreductase